MSLLSRFADAFSSKSKAIGDGFSGNWTVIGSNTDSGVNERNLLASNVEWVYIAVDKVATSVAGVEFKVKKYKSNGDDQEVFDGPLIDFLERPGGGYTGKDFIYLNTVYKELTGNAFWEIISSRGGKLSVAPIIPTVVLPDIAGGKLTGYKVSDTVAQRTVAAKDMLHDRYIDPARPWWGVGRLQKIARWVDTAGFSNEFLRRFFLNGATFGGFIETDEETEERIKLIKMGLHNDHTGVANAHKMGVLPKGSKYTKVTANMGEIEMGATDDRYRDKILSAFGVPKTLVGLTTEVNRASAEAAEYVYARYTLKPIVDDLIEFLNVIVAPLIDPSGKYYFDYENFIPENEEIEIKERESSLNKQAYKTVNEVRAEAGLPPVEGGDVIYGNPGQVALGQPQPLPAPVTDPNAPADEPVAPTPAKSRARGVSGRIRQAIKTERTEKAFDTLITRAAAYIKTAEAETKDVDAEAHKAFVGRVDSYRDQLAQKVKGFNERQQQEVLQRITTITKDVTKADVLNVETEAGIMIDVISPLLGNLITDQALAEFEAQGFPGHLNTSDPRFAEIVALAANRVAESYNDTTAGLLSKALNDGISAGDSLQQIIKRVAQVYEYSDMVRAKAVAQTETFYIANEGSKEAYRQSGVVKTMRWYTAEDEKTCEFCRPEDGRVVGVDEAFYPKGYTLQGADGGKLNLDYRTMDVPPLHTSCRCFIRPETIEIG